MYKKRLAQQWIAGVIIATLGGEVPVHAEGNRLEGLHGGVSYLFWKAEQDNMLIAVQTPPITYTSFTDVQILLPLNTLVNREQHFKGAQGVRLDAGYTFCNDWDASFIWTRIADHNLTILPVLNGLQYFVGFPAALTAAADLSGGPGLSTNAQGLWNYNFNTIEWLAKRLYAPCDACEIAPFVGIMGARIHQCFVTSSNDVVVSGPDNTFAHPGNSQQIAINNFNGVGLAFGMEGSWHICRHLSLVALGKTALLAGSFKLNDANTGMLYGAPAVGTSTTPQGSILSRFNRMRPMVQLSAGFAWDDICMSFGTLGVSVAFEAQYWPNQFLAQRYTFPNSPFGYRSGEDLTFYGLTVRGGLQF